MACAAKTPATGSDCVRTGEPASAQQLAEADALRAAAEQGPLFGTLKAASTVQVCRIRFEPGVVEINWRMIDGGRLRVARDARVELHEQEAWLAVPLNEEPIGWLRRAAVAAFGEEACGIDWRRPETQRGLLASEQVFRGAVCNCQARLRRDASQQVVGAQLRRAC